MALTTNAIFLRKLHIAVLLPAFPLLTVTGCVSSPLPACLLIPIGFSAMFASFLLYRNKEGRKVNANAVLLMDVALVVTYLGLLLPLWIGVAPRRWWSYQVEMYTKLETYSCAFAMVSMTIHLWFLLCALYSAILALYSFFRTRRIRLPLSSECPTCRAREHEEVRGLLEQDEPAGPASPATPAAPPVMMKDGARYMLVDTDASPRSSEDVQRHYAEGEA